MSVLGTMPEGLTCRPIREDDWEAVIACLGRGFPERHRSHWERALARMARRPAVADFPRYGFALDMSGRIVGVLLALYFRHPGPDGGEIRCNLSSWAVDEEFRPYASRLLTTPLRRRDVTFLSVTPAPVTVKVTEALRFKRFAEGQVAFLPALSVRQAPCRVLEARAGLPEMALLPDSDRYTLLEHADLGCRSLVCVRKGVAFPFVFKARRVLRGLVPCCQVIYCRSHAELSQCAGAIGRFLLRKGHLLCVVDANGPVAGLTGRYFAGVGPKHFKGPHPPSLGDLAFTEFVVFDS